MDVHVDAARDDISPGRIDDFRAVTCAGGQSRPDGRDRFTSNRNIVSLGFSLVPEKDTIGNNQIDNPCRWLPDHNLVDLKLRNAAGDGKSRALRRLSNSKWERNRL